MLVTVGGVLAYQAWQVADSFFSSHPVRLDLTPTNPVLKNFADVQLPTAA